MDITFMDNAHRNRFVDSVCTVGAIKPNGHISSYFGAALYILTAMEEVWGGGRYVTQGCIDFDGIFNSYLSSAQEILVKAARSLYVGRNRMDLMDPIAVLSDSFFTLYMTALYIRRYGIRMAGGSVLFELQPRMRVA